MTHFSQTTPCGRYDVGDEGVAGRHDGTGGAPSCSPPRGGQLVAR